jgi:hypothetical protein
VVDGLNPTTSQGASQHLCFLRPALVIGSKIFLIEFEKRAF